jgi:hypothetical protein
LVLFPNSRVPLLMTSVLVDRPIDLEPEREIGVEVIAVVMPYDAGVCEWEVLSGGNGDPFVVSD